jgi:hypothetical protein
MVIKKYFLIILRMIMIYYNHLFNCSPVSFSLNELWSFDRSYLLSVILVSSLLTFSLLLFTKQKIITIKATTMTVIPTIPMIKIEEY